MMRFDAETYLPEDVLTKVDRMSMAHSIESRVPLLDNEVIAVRGRRCRRRCKIKNGRRKHILKEVAATLLPRDDPRPQEAGLRRAARHLVPRQPARAVRRHAALAARASSAATSSSRRSFAASSTSTWPAQRDHTLRLWQLVVFEMWHRRFVDHEPAMSSPVAGVA